MQQESLGLLAFQKMFRTEKACQKHLFELRWPQGRVGCRGAQGEDGYPVEEQFGTAILRERVMNLLWERRQLCNSE